jgi:hypothetical protein
MTMVVFPLSTSSGAGIFCPLKLISYDSVVCSCVMLPSDETAMIFCTTTEFSSKLKVLPAASMLTVPDRR